MFQFLQSKRVDRSVAEISRQRRDLELILQVGFAQYCFQVVCTGSRFHSCMRFHERILSIRNLTNRFEGIPQAVVDEDPARRALMSRLTMQMVESPNNQELMRESSPEDGKVDAAHECSSLTWECDGRVIDYTNPVPVIEVLAFYDLTPSEHTKRIAASHESEAEKKVFRQVQARCA